MTPQRRDIDPEEANQEFEKLNEDVPTKTTEEFYEEYKNDQEAQPKDEMNSVVWRMGIDKTEVAMLSIEREIPKLRNRGWKTVEITMRAV